MKNKLLRTMAIIAVTIGLPCSASALTMINFSADIFANGSFNGETGYGSLTYDESLLDTEGYGEFNPTSGLSAFSFTVFGQTFYASDDIDFDSYPTLEVDDFAPTEVDFEVREVFDSGDPDDNLTDIDMEGLEEFSIFDIENVEFVTASVPDTAGTLGLLAIGISAMVAFRRRV